MAILIGYNLFIRLSTIATAETQNMEGRKTSGRLNNLRLILEEHPQSPLVSAPRHDGTYILREHRLSLKKLVFSMIVFLVFPGAVAYASFFSFFGDMFTKANIQAKSINSQNIILLAAAAGPDVGLPEHNQEVNTVGESALLPDVGPLGGLADIEEGDYDHGQISIYVVREGDSFASIAKMYNVSVNTVLWANDLAKGAKLTIGQTLVILPVSGVQYTVKKGDTLAGIAKKFKGDVDEITSYNGLASVDDSLSVGSVVIIPDGEMPTVVRAPGKPLVKVTSKLRGASGPDYSGYYQAPLASYRKTQGLHGYNGIDLVAYLGAPVMAAAEGDIIISKQGGYNGGYGNYVVILHGNGTQTLYGHLQATAVSVGDHVVQGQVVGYLGNTGRSTGPHLHFEVRGARNPF